LAFPTLILPFLKEFVQLKIKGGEQEICSPLYFFDKGYPITQDRDYPELFHRILPLPLGNGYR